MTREAWLRGPVEGVPAALMPAAHSLMDALEEIEAAVSGLDTQALWVRPGGAASIGFHLRHAGGSIRRLLTYARGEALDPGQLAAIKREAEPGTPPAGVEELLHGLRDAIELAMRTYRQTDPETLDEPRKVGRAGLPSSTRGLLFHLADHTRRHAGQVVTTAKIVRGLDLTDAPDAERPRGA
ncbi:MAG TPA: DinB family protein [Longimicrobiales bacterium]|nr:DinB family protein [Longimicrobiales bacterium]